MALTILCPCLQSHNILLLIAREGWAPQKTTVDDGCHQDREGVGHEVADPEEVWWSLEVMMGMLDAWWILWESQEKRQRILNLLMGGLKLMGKMKAMVSFPWNFPSFSPKAVRTWSFLPWSIQILKFSYTERVVVYLVLSHYVPYTKEWYSACIAL